MNEIIEVKQLPIIEERLLSIKSEFESKTNAALALPCTEETYKEVKKARADITKIYTDLESRRKAVKNAIMEPYERFNAVYENCVRKVYDPAKATLDKKIREVEDAIKAEKEDAIQEYFEQSKGLNDIDWVVYEQANIKVTMQASMKSLKESIDIFFERIKDAMTILRTQPEGMRAEILVEYKKSLNIAAAINIVKSRREAIEAERARAAEQTKQNEIEERCIAVPDELFDEPDELFNSEERIYRITGDLTDFEALEAFMCKNGIEYRRG